MQAEQRRIRERNQREQEKILRNIAEYENELQEEMFRDFDQSTFSLGLQGFHNSLYITTDILSDSPQADSDFSFHFPDSVISTSSPLSQQRLRSISERVKTPGRLGTMISSINDRHLHSF